MSVGPGAHASWNPALTRIQPHVDLVVVEVGTRHQDCRYRSEVVWMGVLGIQPLLQAGIVLLESVAVHRIVQEEREVGVEVEEGTGQEAVRFEGVSIRSQLAVVYRRRPELDPAAVAWIDKAKTVQHAFVDKIEWNLAAGIEIVPSKQEPKPNLLILTERFRVVRVEVVPAIAARTLERPICVGAFVGHVSVNVFDIGAVGKESTARIEVAALKPQSEPIRQRFPLANMNHAKAAEIAVLGTERAVDDRDILNQFRAECLEGAKVALSVALGSLILLYVIDQDLETAVYAAVVEVETRSEERRVGKGGRS